MNFVGPPNGLSITAKNIGTSTIPHVVLDFDGLGSYVTNKISGCNRRARAIDSPENPYDFGRLATGHESALDLTPKGYHVFSESAYGNVNRDGTLDTSAEISDPEANGQWSTGIPGLP